MTTKTAIEGDHEFRALKAVLDALRPLDYSARERVINWCRARISAEAIGKPKRKPAKLARSGARR